LLSNNASCKSESIGHMAVQLSPHPLLALARLHTLFQRPSSAASKRHCAPLCHPHLHRGWAARNAEIIIPCAAVNTARSMPHFHKRSPLTTEYEDAMESAG
jgi:hypothetical protein